MNNKTKRQLRRYSKKLSTSVNPEADKASQIIDKLLDMVDTYEKIVKLYDQYVEADIS